MNAMARAVLENIERTANPYVFPGTVPGRPRWMNYHMLWRVREKAGLPKNFRPMHGLRHTFASWLANTGQVSMYELQKLLTHSSPHMTQRYAHLRDEALRRASELAGVLFEEAEERDRQQN
jgi:integrase